MTVDHSSEGDELDQFFELVAPELARAVTRAWAERGAPLSEQEIYDAMLEALRRIEGDAIREVFGADVGAFYDGKNSQ